MTLLSLELVIIMDKKITIIIVAIIAIIVIAAAVILLSGNNNKPDEPDTPDTPVVDEGTIVIYVQDTTECFEQTITGKGETAIDQAIDAFAKANIDYTVDKEKGWVTTINGKGTVANEDGSYSYWLLYVWDKTGKQWNYSDTTITGLANDVGYISYYYGTTSGMDAPTFVPTYSPVDNRTLTVYLENGMEHQYGTAKGIDSLFAAENAVREMGVEITVSAKGWVSTIDGIGSTQNADGSWSYWIFYTWNATDKVWEYASTTVSNIDSSVDTVCWCYGSTDSVTYQPLRMPVYSPTVRENPVLDYNAAQVADNFVSGYSGAFGDFEVTESTDSKAKITTVVETLLKDGSKTGKTRAVNAEIYTYASESEAQTALNDFLVNSKNGSQGKTLLDQTDKLGMATVNLKIMDYRNGGASDFYADKGYLMYASYESEKSAQFTQCAGAMQYGKIVIVINQTTLVDLYYPHATTTAETVPANYVSVAQYEQMLMDFFQSFFMPANISYVDDPVLWVLGNADGNHLINYSDVAIIKNVIQSGGSADKYKFCDANNDGKIDNNDIAYVETMINGTAAKLYFKDIDGNIGSHVVRDSLNIVSVNQCNLQEVNLIINKDPNNKVVGGDQQIGKYNNVFNLDVGTDIAGGQVVLTGTKNGEVQAEIISQLLKQYGHVEITLGSVNSYGTNLENDFGGDDNVSIIRLPSWEDRTESGVLTYGYLFGGVQNNTCWQQALTWYDWYCYYTDVIIEQVSSIPMDQRPNVITMYVKDCYPGATDKVLSTGSGDCERSILCGANNIGDYFGTGYVAVTPEDMAACQKAKGIDIIIAEPSGVYGDDGKQMVINAVALTINEFDGYISPETDLYSLSFMVTTGPACVVSNVFFAKTFYPENEAFAAFDADQAFAEFLEMAGWADRTDISDIVCYGPGHTTTPI